MIKAHALAHTFDLLTESWKQQVSEIYGLSPFGGHPGVGMKVFDEYWLRCLDMILMKLTQRELERIKELVPPACSN